MIARRKIDTLGTVVIRRILMTLNTHLPQRTSSHQAAVRSSLPDKILFV